MAQNTKRLKAENYGTNAVMIVGKQKEFETPVSEVPGDSPAVGKMRPEIVELRPPTTLQPVRGFYRADRQKGSPSPDPLVPGMEMGGGDINFFADPHTLAFWLGELLMYDEDISSIGYKLPALADDIASLTIAAANEKQAAGIAADKQPGAQLAALTEFTVTKHTDGSGPDPGMVKRPQGLTAVQLTLSGAAVVKGAKITLEGTDHNDTFLVDRLTIGDDDASKKSLRWFKTITAVMSSTTGVLKITGDPETYFHRLLFTKEVNDGLTLEVHEGNRNTPITYAGAHIARGIISVEQVVRAMFRITANCFFPRKSISGGPMGTDLSLKANGFTRAKPNFIPDWGTSWEVVDTDGVPSDLLGQHDLAATNFIIDNLLGPPATRFAEKKTYPKVVRKGNRDLLLAVQVNHHKDLNFDQLVGGAFFESVLSMVSRESGRRYQSIRCTAKNSQLVSFPSRPMMNLAEVLANLAIRLNIGDAPDGNDEAVIDIFNDSATL